MAIALPVAETKEAQAWKLIVRQPESQSCACVWWLFHAGGSKQNQMLPSLHRSYDPSCTHCRALHTRPEDKIEASGASEQACDAFTATEYCLRWAACIRLSWMWYSTPRAEGVAVEAGPWDDQDLPGNSTAPLEETECALTSFRAACWQR